LLNKNDFLIGDKMNSIISKIDITPLVGVALILVIVFMVTAPLMMTPADLGINLPKAKTVEAKSQTNITISYSENQELALNETLVNISLLGNELKKIIDKNPERIVVIRADKNVKHKQVLKLLGIAKKSGATRMAIATLQRNRDEV
jgi:biopolymer transport protein ExbD